MKVGATGSRRASHHLMPKSRMAVLEGGVMPGPDWARDCPRTAPSACLGGFGAWAMAKNRQPPPLCDIEIASDSPASRHPAPVGVGLGVRLDAPSPRQVAYAASWREGT